MSADQTIDSGYLLERRHRRTWNGMTEAVRDHDTPFLFAWLVEAFSYQGIADARASAYMDLHGRITFGHVARGLERDPACPKLTTYWHFRGLPATASSRRVAPSPSYFVTCPLPRHDLRNGRLNQMAYALFLFVRDVCGGDLVGWIDERSGGGRPSTCRRRARGDAGRPVGALEPSLRDLVQGAGHGTGRAACSPVTPTESDGSLREPP